MYKLLLLSLLWHAFSYSPFGCQGMRSVRASNAQTICSACLGRRSVQTTLDLKQLKSTQLFGSILFVSLSSNMYYRKLWQNDLLGKRKVTLLTVADLFGTCYSLASWFGRFLLGCGF